jgi:hypothetical protein
VAVVVLAAVAAVAVAQSKHLNKRLTSENHLFSEVSLLYS